MVDLRACWLLVVYHVRGRFFFKLKLSRQTMANDDDSVRQQRPHAFLVGWSLVARVAGLPTSPHTLSLGCSRPTRGRTAPRSAGFRSLWRRSAWRCPGAAPNRRSSANRRLCTASARRGRPHAREPASGCRRPPRESTVPADGGRSPPVPSPASPVRPTPARSPPFAHALMLAAYRAGAVS
jgi:hypothetical protein